ncbi:MAG: hypothetical protein J4F29_14120 [Candidatus Latescibacteria bacterium]|nr:hypothetical protein [Candidatus Latescibacterota bacterium]
MSDDHNSIKEYKGILGQVTSPLIFFALALLVIEGIIGITVVKSQLDAMQQFYMIIVMAFLFLAVVGLVAWITVKYPLNLMDKVDESIARNEEIENFVESDIFRDTVVDIVADIVQRSQSKERENGSK